MKQLIMTAAVIAWAGGAAGAGPEEWLEFAGGGGPGQGKRVVLVSGDEEYRSEEVAPMLGRMLAERHGFHCTVLFAIDPASGEINPDKGDNIPGLEALDRADFAIFALRFRELPDEQMKHIVDYVEAGKPLLGLRTSTHAFRYKNNKDSPYAHWSFNSKKWPGGFGRQVLGETWVSHHGAHGKQSTRGLPASAAKDHPLLRGVEDVWGPSDVYTVRGLPTDAVVLLDGQVLTGMKPDDPPAGDGKNDPMMPLAWIRERATANGGSQMVICSTMGAATDFVHPGLRRFVVNAVFHGCGIEIPAELDVSPVGEFQPTDFGFGSFRKGLKPANLAR